MRCFRLPHPVDRSTLEAAAAAMTTQAAIVIRILIEAIQSGQLPTPSEVTDPNQLRFL